MGYPTKIATCCYCGSRAALVLGKDRHELNCASCGAQLHDMKRFKQQPAPAPSRRTGSAKSSNKPKKPNYPDHYPPRRKYVKKRKGMMRYLIKEAFEVIEDIFD